LEKKDLSKQITGLTSVAVAMSAEDWETKYKEIWAKYAEEQKRTEVLKERLVTKQERYIQRE
jgi:hypothetical protein